MVIRNTLVLTGPLAGKTILLGNRFQFTDGRYTVEGEHENVRGVIKYLGSCYQAFPETRENEVLLKRSVTKLEMVLTGPYAGRTITLNNRYPFVDGSYVIEGELEALQGLIQYLGSVYQAFPSGSDELEAAQARHAARVKEKSDGKHDVQASPKRDSDEAVRGVDGSDGEQPPSEADAGDGGSDAAPTGSEGSDAPAEGGQPPVVNQRLLDAVMGLSPNIDAYWTPQGGLPALDAVAKRYGVENLLRREVEEAAPGYRRPARTQE